MAGRPIFFNQPIIQELLQIQPAKVLAKPSQTKKWILKLSNQVPPLSQMCDKTKQLWLFVWDARKLKVDTWKITTEKIIVFHLFQIILLKWAQMSFREAIKLSVNSWKREAPLWKEFYLKNFVFSSLERNSQFVSSDRINIFLTEYFLWSMNQRGFKCLKQENFQEITFF